MKGGKRETEEIQTEDRYYSNQHVTIPNEKTLILIWKVHATHI